MAHLFHVVRNPQEIAKAQLLQGGIELRLDCFERVDLKALKALITSDRRPFLLTLRKKDQGGSFQGSEKQRLALLAELFALHPAWIDLEWDVEPSFFAEMARAHPGVKILCSYHDFDKTPEDLPALLKQMENSQCAAYKIATMAHSFSDALRMALFVKKQAGSGVKIVGICMGEKGQITRLLGPIMGNCIHYAADQPVEGQLNGKELFGVYNFDRLSPSTAIYALIGAHVAHSPGHLVHNRVIRELNENALYIKISLEESELGLFFEKAKELGIRGLSVTMPFKEKVIPFLDEIDSLSHEMQAVNTVVFCEDSIKGFNTDGQGAVAALEKRGGLRGKRAIILGAGGAGRAIAHSLRAKGVDVAMLNRTPSADVQPLERIKAESERGYDILINCTSVDLPIDPHYLLSSALIMEINMRSLQPPLIMHALSKQARIVEGYEMFIEQALLQVRLWFDKSLDDSASLITIAALASLQGH